ncbi:hypothetical protein RYX36_026755, partial [Vicia faba]
MANVFIVLAFLLPLICKSNGGLFDNPFGTKTDYKSSLRRTQPSDVCRLAISYLSVECQPYYYMGNNSYKGGCCSAFEYAVEFRYYCICDVMELGNSSSSAVMAFKLPTICHIPFDCTSDAPDPYQFRVMFFTLTVCFILLFSV